MQQYIANRRGFSLIEVLIYVAVLVATSTVIVSALLTLSRSYAELSLMHAMQLSALTTFDRVSHEVRLAENVDIAGSTLGTHPGVLRLDNITEGVTDTVEFFLSGGTLRILENDVDAGALTVPDITVSNLVFQVIDNGVAEGVRTELTLRGSIGTTEVERVFYSFAVMRK